MSKVRQIIRESITELLDDSRCIFCGDITNEDLRKWFGKGGAGGTTKGGAAYVRRKRRDQKKAGDAKKGKQRSKGKKPVMSKTGA
jgi:2-keto-3-deoxy-6-phosphogluconate aldolase